MKHEILRPQYGNCIANLACSVLKYYGLQPPNETLPQADALLDREYKNVVVLVLGGMGAAVIEQQLQNDSVFRANMKAVYSAVFPPTSVAGVAAMHSGLYPNQSGWLGWKPQSDAAGRTVICYRGNDDDVYAHGAKPGVTDEQIPYKSICERIAGTGVRAYMLSKYTTPELKTFFMLSDRIVEKCSEKGRAFVCAYWENADLLMHSHGTDQKVSGVLMRDFEYNFEYMCDALYDTLFIVTADHGHINVTNRYLEDHPDITDCLASVASTGTRVLNLFVRQGMEKQLEEAFGKHFKDEFMLIPKQEALECGLFGKGQSHDSFEEMVGDYIAVATGDTALCSAADEDKGNHSGITKAEMEIPLISVSNKEREEEVYV